jgi:ParD-like antitoxin of type II bacterial toxin-antitoxin system
MATANKRKTAAPTPVPVRFAQDEERLLRMMTAHAKAESRSVSGQIKHYARIGLIAQDNPDIPLGMIEDILVAQEESKAGLGEPYKFGVVED